MGKLVRILATISIEVMALAPAAAGQTPPPKPINREAPTILAQAL